MQSTFAWLPELIRAAKATVSSIYATNLTDPERQVGPGGEPNA
jgi:hypothetical protein